MLGLRELGVGILGEGLILEFGVYLGKSLNEIAELYWERVVYGFDWWGGLPEAWVMSGGRVIPKGYFACIKPRVDEFRANVVLVEGLFTDSLGPFLEGHSGPVALVHLDADLYSSTIFVLSGLRDRFIAGSVLMFDEIAGKEGWQEAKAWEEYREANSGQVWGLVGKQHLDGEVWRLDNIA